MCSGGVQLLHLECKGEIVNVYLPGEDVRRAERDLVYAQELFNVYKSSNGATENRQLVERNSIPNGNNAEEFQEEVDSQCENAEVQDESSNSVNNNDSFGSEAETLLFISLYENHKEDFSHAKKRKHIWAIIEEEMAAHNYFRDKDKLERKWTNLMRVYRAIKDNKGPKKTGRGAQNYKYYEKIEEIVGDKPSNNPQSSAVLDIGVNIEDVVPAHDDNNEDSLESDATKSSATVNESESSFTPKRRKQNQSMILKKEKMLQKEKRQQEMMELEKKSWRWNRRKLIY